MISNVMSRRYTMLLGRPPFETTNLKETYRCIREARYSMPSSLSPQAKHLISSMLAKNPENRPRLDDIIQHDFFCQVGVRGTLNLSSPILRRGVDVLNFYSVRVSHQKDCLQAAAMPHRTSTTPARPRTSSRKLRLPFLVERKTKPNTLRLTVSTFFYDIPN